jgi:FG-GAP-like repeat/FG-GAP repeat
MLRRYQCCGVLTSFLVLAASSLTSDQSRSPDSLGYHLPYSFPVAATGRLLAHADLNGDGKEDLILAGQSSHMRERGIQILEGNGDGTFKEGITIVLQNPTRAVVVADVNGDGKPDLILLHPGVAVLLNTTANPGAPVSFGSEQSLAGGFGPALAAADLNGDGRAEVLLGTTPTRQANDELGTLRVVSAPRFIDQSHPSGSAPSIDVPIPGIPVSIVVSDFDGDGKPDVAVGFTGPLHEGRGSIAVLLNRTEGSHAPIRFADPIFINFDHAVDFIASSDLNGDGRYDLFAAWCTGREELCGAVSLLNTKTPEGGIAFTRHLVPLPVQRASNWVLQDVDRDGKPDLLFLSLHQGVAFPTQAPGEIVVAQGLGDGRFAPPRTFSAPTPDSLGFALADFNGDGLLDLAILDGAFETPRINILLGRKHFGFSAPESLVSSFIPTAMIPFSNHGRPTGFIVTNTAQSGRASSGNNTAAIFAGDFLNPRYSPISTISHFPEGAITVGDLKTDGHKEMVLVTASEVQVYNLESKTRSRPIQAAKLQQTRGGFLTTPQRAILADLNGDGKPDLIVGNGYDSNLQIYMNISTDTFSFATPISVPWCPKGFPPVIMKGFVSLSIELASADINSDGRPDLVASGHCGLNIMLNRKSDQGAIAFDQPLPIVDSTQQAVFRSGIFALADINRDGKPDVMLIENNNVNGGESSAVDVLLNETSSSPSFRPVQHLQAGKRITSVAVADFNHDGWPDIAAVDAAEGTLTFLLNDGKWKSQGAFRVHSSFTIMPNLQQVLVIDHPGDGLPELLVRNQERVAILR